MRPLLPIAAVQCLIAAAQCLLCVSCGYVGDPLPPALNIASPITDLEAIELGDRLRVDFTIPPLTTEGLTLTRVGTVELRVGAGTNPFDTNRWAAGAKAYPLDVAKTGKAVGEIPAAEWIGKEVVVGVHVINPKGRSSNWSNLVSMRVYEPLATPANVKAASDPKGALVTWESAENSFRIFRKGPNEKDSVEVGTSTARTFLDAGAQFGAAYEYTVQAVHEHAQSGRSQPVVFTPKDEFPPEPPAGLTAVAGIGAIELVWDRNTEPDLRGYRVYRANENGAFARVAELIETPAYSDRAVESGKKYRYAISAVDQSGNESKQSVAAEAAAP
ncbi:MAG: hypothetical protein JSU00_01325 [Acidobacteria bacterium]|nr:hypothetical protein [Acidobacteriota bacterium]